MIPWRSIISGSNGPIFIRFSQNGRYCRTRARRHQIEIVITATIKHYMHTV